MPCTRAKTMRFRVYKCDPIPQGFPTSQIHSKHMRHDTGKVFSITSPDDTLLWSKSYYGPGTYDQGITEHSIVGVMMKKLFNMEGNYVNGLAVYWSGEGPFISGSVFNNNFYIVREV